MDRKRIRVKRKQLSEELNYYKSGYQELLLKVEAKTVGDVLSLEAYLAKVIDAKGRDSEDDTLITKNVLASALLKELKTQALSPEEVALRGSLLTKFEVYGKIFSRYTKHFRKASDDCSALENYLLLGLLLSFHYQRESCLKALNCFFKLADFAKEVLQGVEAGEPALLAQKVLAEAIILEGELSR